MGSFNLNYTYLTAEAVAHSADFLHAQSLADVLDSRVDDGLDVRGLVLGEPCRQIRLARIHIGGFDLITPEQIGDDGQVAIGGVLVGEEQGIGEETEDVGQEENGLLGGLVVLRVDDVGVDWGFGSAGLVPGRFGWLQFGEFHYLRRCSWSRRWEYLRA